MNANLKSAIGKLLSPSDWYQKAIYHIGVCEGNIGPSFSKTEYAIDSIDVTASISGYDEEIQVDAEINSRTLSRAHAALVDMKQTWMVEQENIRTLTIDSLLEDMARTLGHLEPQLREISEQEGVRDEWMTLVNDLDAITNFVEFAAKNLDPKTTLWLLDGIEGSQRRPYMLMEGIQHFSTLLGKPGWDDLNAG